MGELYQILKKHRPAQVDRSGLRSDAQHNETPTHSEIPDLFFDEILVEFKLSRVEILVLMYLYRNVYCKPNLHRKYGISQILSHTDMSKNLNISLEDLYHALRKVEEFGFITTIRSGQYFVRKYFTKDRDEEYGQGYDDFDV